jgi:hypothetical protein
MGPVTSLIALANGIADRVSLFNPQSPHLVAGRFTWPQDEPS